MSLPIIQDCTGGVVLTVHVQPKASQSACVGIHGNALKIRIAAPPSDGAANKELIRFLAGELSVPVAAVRIESGAAGRHKRVRVMGKTAEQVMACLVPKESVKR